MVLYQKICLQESEVWRKVVSNKIIVTLVTQGLLSSFLSRPLAQADYCQELESKYSFKLIANDELGSRCLKG